jgi:5'-3' exonuclease
MSKKYQAIKYHYEQHVGKFSYEAGYVVLMVQALTRVMTMRPVPTIYFCLDGTPLRHRIIYPNYKIDKSMPVNLYPTSAFLTNLRRKFPAINVCFLPGEEADTVASSLVYLLRDRVMEEDKVIGSLNEYEVEDDPRLMEDTAGLNHRRLAITPTDEEICLCTSDADWYQLLEFPNICIDKTLSLAETDKSGATPKSVMEVAPHQISAYKALKGDHSDGLSGVKIKGFDTMEYIRALKSSHAFEDDAFTGGENSLFNKLKTPSEDYNKVYANYLVARLGFAAIPYVLV